MAENQAQHDEKIIKHWEDKKVFERSVEERPKNKAYVFYDGPPFATGLPHYGHILGSTIKDVVPRYQTMKGFRVERRWGWDCHGLPIEAIGEKDLKISGKQQIEAFGVEKFNEYCRSKVLTYAKEWRRFVRQMGRWIDFDNSYKTMDNTYIESVWWAFKEMYKKGYIYEGKKVLLFCPRSQTPISNFEIQMDNSYKTVTDKAATVAFKLKAKPDHYVLAWTTTPWTLIGNVALAINSKLHYVKAKTGNRYYILAKELLEAVLGKDYESVESISTQELLGQEYEPLYHVEAADKSKKGFYVIDGGDEVSATDGTGVVHMAAYGEFDYEMIKKYDLPLIQHLDDQGKLRVELKTWKGLWFKNVDKEVLADLDERNILVWAKDYTHSYPFSPRYDVPLFYNAIPAWFVDIQKIKQRLFELNENINWYPEHVKEGRFKHNLETAPDWNISRNRFWASSLPVWKCTKCNETLIVGSIKELQQHAADKSQVPDDVDLHKHSMDKVHCECLKCHGTMNRIPEVFDCWFESASMPFAAMHYPFENKEWFDENFPAQFISEYTGQIRAWFYVMHVMSAILFDKHPFENVVVSGVVLAEDGSKMSKSKNNFPDPWLVFEKYGADSLRFYLMSSVVMKAESVNFSEDGVKDIFRKLVTITRNVVNFYSMFTEGKKHITLPHSKHILDKWILSELHTLVNEITDSMENYDTVNACRSIIPFADKLSTWYLRRSRERFKSNDEQDKLAAQDTLGYVLLTFAKVIAPITPFLAEEIYLALKQKDSALGDSIHLESWPHADKQLIDANMNATMERTRTMVTAGLDEREKVKIGIRQALAKASFVVKESVSDEFAELIADELNVKTIEQKEDAAIEQDTVTCVLDTEITPELRAEGISREIIRQANALRKENNLTVKDRIEFALVTTDKDVLEALKVHKDTIAQAIQADHIHTTPLSDAKQKEIRINEVSVSISLSAKAKHAEHASSARHQ